MTVECPVNTPARGLECPVGTPARGLEDEFKILTHYMEKL